MLRSIYGYALLNTMSYNFDCKVRYGMNESDKARNPYHEKMDGGCDMNKHVSCYQSVITHGDAPVSLQYMGYVKLPLTKIGFMSEKPKLGRMFRDSMMDYVVQQTSGNS